MDNNFCILTNFDINVEHGMGRYTQNLINIFNISLNHIYKFENLTSDLINYINKSYDYVNIQTGLLKRNEKYILSVIDNISIPKIFTIHSVIDEEIKYIKEMYYYYFPKLGYTLNTHYGEDYEIFLNKMDGLIFYTNSDKEIFFKHYKYNKPYTIISPSVEYIFKNQISNRIKKTKNLGYLGRIDYRKGCIASFNLMEFIPDYNLDVYGLIMTDDSRQILEYFLSKNRNMKYKGLLLNKEYYFDNTSIFLGNSLYEPFGFSHVENLVNYVTPIIGKNTGTCEIFGKNYPYVVGDDIYELKNTVELIINTSEDKLTEILNDTISNIKYLDNKLYKEKYIDFIKLI